MKKNYNEILMELDSIENRRTADIDKYNKILIKSKIDVSDLKTIAYPIN